MLNRKLTVFADKPVHQFRQLCGDIFFEDINFGADGGLYAELVKNRSFEFPTANDGLERKQSKLPERKNSYYQQI